ncbi:MAG: hypothetical protein ACSW8G_04960 [Bacillota bacterium]
MKNRKKIKKLFGLITALLVSALMCFCMSACGDDGNTEETVEITTPSEEAAPLEKGDNASIASGSDQNASEDKDSKDSGKAKSEYESIYNDYKARMKEAKGKYEDELKEKSSSLSKSKLYDETQDRIDGLREIYDEGKDKMVEAMLASTNDDAKTYKKYFNKLTDDYTEYTRDITSVYMDAF